MNDATVIAPSKNERLKLTIRSVICQKKQATEALVETLKINSIANVLNLCRERHRYEDTAAVEFVQRTENETTPIICEENGSYYRSRYKEFSGRSKLDRAIDRF